MREVFLTTLTRTQISFSANHEFPPPGLIIRQWFHFLASRWEGWFQYMHVGCEHKIHHSTENSNKAHSVWTWPLIESKIPRYTLLGNRNRSLHCLNQRSWWWLSEYWTQFLDGGSVFAIPKREKNPPTRRWQFSNRIKEVPSLSRPACTEISWQQPHLKRAERMFVLQNCSIFFSWTVVEASPEADSKLRMEKSHPGDQSHSSNPCSTTFPLSMLPSQPSLLHCLGGAEFVVQTLL